MSEQDVTDVKKLSTCKQNGIANIMKDLETKYRRKDIL